MVNVVGAVYWSDSTGLCRLFLAAFLVMFLGSVGSTDEAPKDARLAIVCSTTQIADFARQVVGDDWDVRCVLAPGQDPHLYDTTPNDIRLVRQADLCLANGWHLEGNDWMRTLADNVDKPLVNCTDGVPPLMVDDEESKRPVRDPHAWFSPENAAVYVRNILLAVVQLDPEGKARYRARTEFYLRQLRSLDLWVKQQVSAIPRERRVLVTSHDAFAYFCDRYGFKAAAPEGWNTGEEIGGGATYARRQQAVESIRSFGVPAIFVETSVNPKLIRDIADEAGVEVGGELYSDSMGPAGTTAEHYLGMMRENVLMIVEALK